MKLKLTTKNQNKCFHLRGVQNVRSNLKGIACLEGIRFHDVYKKTRFTDNANVEIEIPRDDRVKAYYLCGISKGTKYHENMGIAFVPCDGQNVHINNAKIHLEVTDAREIRFKSNEPISHVFGRHVKAGMPI